MNTKKEEILNPDVFCPIRQTIKILGKRWTILIIKEIYYSSKHRLSFMELKKRLENVSTKVLSERLKEMVSEGMLNRNVHAEETPIRVYYTLTSKGKDSCRIIEGLKEYGIKWGNNQTNKCSDITCEVCTLERHEKNKK